MTEPVIPDESAHRADKIRNPVKVTNCDTVSKRGGGSDYPPVHLLPTYLVNKSCVRTEDFLVQSRCSNQLSSLDQLRAPSQLRTGRIGAEHNPTDRRPGFPSHNHGTGITKTNARDKFSGRSGTREPTKLERFQSLRKQLPPGGARS